MPRQTRTKSFLADLNERQKMLVDREVMAPIHDFVSHNREQTNLAVTSHCKSENATPIEW